MSKYLIIICSLLVVVGCSGGGADDVDLSNGNGGGDNTADDRFNWALDGSEEGGGGGSSGGYVTDDGDSGGSRSTVISITGSVPAKVYAYEVFQLKLTASGGSGAYEWETTDLPDWLTLNETGDRQVTLDGTPTYTRNYTFKVRARDADEPTSYKEKTYTVKVKAKKTPIVGRTGSPTPDTPDTGDPIEISIEATPAASGQYDVAAKSQFNKVFVASGGSGGYTWSFTEENIEGGAFNMFEHVSSGITVTDLLGTASGTNMSRYRVKGNFKKIGLYCLGSSGDWSHLSPLGGIAEDCFDASSMRVMVSRLTVRVTDAAGNSADETFVFNLMPPRVSDQTLGDLSSFGVYIWADKFNDCTGEKYVKATLYAMHGSVKRKIAVIDGLLPAEMGETVEETVTVELGQGIASYLFDPYEEDIRDLPLTALKEIEFDVRDCGISGYGGGAGYGEIKLSWFAFYTPYSSFKMAPDEEYQMTVSLPTGGGHVTSETVDLPDPADMDWQNF